MAFTPRLLPRVNKSAIALTTTAPLACAGMAHRKGLRSVMAMVSTCVVTRGSTAVFVPLQTSGIGINFAAVEGQIVPDLGKLGVLHSPFIHNALGYTALAVGPTSAYATVGTFLR